MFKVEELPARRRSWIRLANVPWNRQGWLLEDCTDTPSDVLKRLNSWISLINEGRVIKTIGDKMCGRGVFLYGPPGRGKTTLALAIIQQVIKTTPFESLKPGANKVMVRPCYFLTYNDLLNLKGKEIEGDLSEDEARLFQGIFGQAQDDAYNVRVLIIDDVGKEHMSSKSEWNKAMLHHVLRTRFNNGLPTIVTTNASRDNWAAIYGEATASFVKEAFIYEVVTGGDLR